MKGLFIKDLYILKQRKMAIVMFVAIIFVLGSQAGIEFAVVGYAAILFGILAQGTIAYDDDGNCMSYLMTLPITIKEYVAEKFIFSGLSVFFGWFVSLIFGYVISLYKIDVVVTGETIFSAFVAFLLFVAILNMYIPIQIKFGSEKSRFVIMGVGAVVFIIALVVKKMNLKVPEGIENASPGVVLLVVILFSVLLSVVAFMWSMKILKDREY